MVTPLEEPSRYILDGENHQACEWVDLDKIADVDLVPALLTEKLTNLSSSVEHVLNFEDLSQ